MVNKNLLGLFTAITLAGVVGGGTIVTAKNYSNINANTNIGQITNQHNNEMKNKNGLLVQFGKTQVKTLTPEKSKEYLKDNPNIPKFKNQQEANAYANKILQEIKSNANISKAQNNQLYYTGVNTVTQSESFGQFDVILNAPYAVSWSNTLGNYYSSNSNGYAYLGLSGMTAGFDLDNTWGFSTIHNNQHELSAEAGGDIVISLWAGGMINYYNTPVSLQGSWTVPGAL